MTLYNLSKEHLQLIIDSVNTNPAIKAHIREEIVKLVKNIIMSNLKGAHGKEEFANRDR